jgi:amino acid adenylation domain-containing protein
MASLQRLFWMSGRQGIEGGREMLDAEGPTRGVAAATAEPAHVAEAADLWRIEEAFGAAARRWGERPALETCGTSLSYAELEARANGLARRLVAAGVAPGETVAMACRDLAQFAIGALAILKSGAAYLALDLRYPSQRTPEAVFREAARRLIGGDEGLARAAATAGVGTIGDAFDPPPAGAPDPGPPERRGEARSAAYLCYTSGTTGQAKAVIVPHAGVRGLVSHRQFDALTAGGRMACCSTFAFDGITFEVWGALLNGGCVVETPLEVVRAPWRMAAHLQAARIDTGFLTTSLFNAVAMHRPNAFGAMSCLVVGGEALDPAYVGRVLESGRPPRRLLNGYGPTEATTFATTHLITPADVARGAIPIGRPVEGRAIHLITAEGAIAGPGEEGELCISGPAVAVGYLNAAELTRAKFATGLVPHAPHLRVYRTGDLCRSREDGAIEYLGRLDEQVKVRGYRVEPAGVAARLRGIAGVAEARVLARPGPFGSRELVAFLRGDGRTGEAELLRAAGELMPDYMLPSAFRWVEAFPLKANGKVDAAALLARLEAPEPRDGAGGGHGSSSELALVGIWLRNGGRPGFDLDTPFDEVCDSLAMVGVMIDIEATFGRQLPLWALTPPVTIRSMSAALQSAPAPATSAAAGVRTFYLSQPWNMNRPADAICEAVSGGEPWGLLQVAPGGAAVCAYDSVDVMAEILEAQVRAASSGAPCRLVGHSFGGVLAFALAGRLARRGAPVERLVLLDSAIARARSRLGRAGVQVRQLLLLAATDPARARALLAGRARRAVEGDTRSRALKIRARCVQAMMRYAPEPIAAPALLVRCTRYDDLLEHPANSLMGLTWPWERLVGSLQVIEIDCTHAELVRDEPYVSRVAADLRAALRP